MFLLPDALDAIKNHREFIPKYYNEGLVSFDYVFNFAGTFAHTFEETSQYAYYLWELAGKPPSDGKAFWFAAERYYKKAAWIRRNLRGTTFCQETGRIISLPLEKFFNVDQIEETKFDNIKHMKAQIYEKCDGSCIHFFIHPKRGDLLASTRRSSQTDHAIEALKFANETKLSERIKLSISKGLTPVFEFVSHEFKFQIVIRHDKTNLVYLISRNMETGEYVFEDDYPCKAKKFDFDFNYIMSHLDGEQFEGYVCHLENGMLVKKKTKWYMDNHNTFDFFQRPGYKIYADVFLGIVDDVIAVAPDNYKNKLTLIYNQAQGDWCNEKIRLVELFESIVIPDCEDEKARKKAFVFEIKKFSQEDFAPLIMLYNEKDIDSYIQEKLVEKYKIDYPNRIDFLN